MEVVIDSNVLFRMLISQGEIIELFFNNTLKIYTPQILRKEFCNHSKEILSKSNLSKKDFHELSSLLFSRISFVSLKEYKEFYLKLKNC